ncbi:MAG: ribonuclease P protein component [Rhodoferax sp.]|nr:ribonuclease P protein component [Rhodoferax sp.]MCF8209037.1 ribonuclease P protein component [Rhodoferax sp.]
MRRLKTRPQFQAVLSGVTLARTTHFALHSLAVRPESMNGPAMPDLFLSTGPWLGAMVPKRWARRAVTRNCIKRQIYQMGSENEHALGACMHLVRLRAAFDRKQFPSATSDALRVAVRAELLELFDRSRRARGVLSALPCMPAAAPS